MSASPELTVVADGLRFPEGPVALYDGSVLVVEIERQTLSKVWPDGRIEIVATLGGGPNGVAIGPDGAAYVCNNGGFEWHEIGGALIPSHKPHDYCGGSIQRVDLQSGEVTLLYTECGGKLLLGPNDLVFDAHGGFYFSDHGKSTDDYRENGALYYATSDGSTISRLKDGLLGPNGVGISPDGKRLYVAETPTSRVWAFDIISPGVFGDAPTPFQPGHLVCTLPQYRLLDSLKVEAGGRICVGTLIDGGITVFDTEGGHEFVAFPGEVGVTNLCFGGDDMRDCWATASPSGRLYKFRWPRAGLPLEFNA
ncbi:SMP-30/gluconolactonase/LRE family protein [Hyphomonas sp.]|uniref:SMP-30/gluconolactonase/LRE family protein n=1 Tax=Hyphomonas sp. TaxID=87 RepID=UPI0035656FE0